MNKWASGLLSVLILAAGVGTMAFLIHSRPKAATRPRKPGAVPVDVIRVYPLDRPVSVDAMGVVMAARTVRVQPQVAGRVMWVSPALVPGGRLQKGEVLVRIDDRDYRAAVIQRRAALQKAKYELLAEQARGEVAKREWSMMRSKVRTSPAGRALALRKPQLAAARAAVQSAQSALKVAQLNLERTVLRAPFDAIVTDKRVDTGQVVGPGAVLATVVDTTHFWVRATVAVDELSWFALPDAQAKGGASAEVVQILADGRRFVRKGRVIRLLGDLEPKGRLARVLIEVQQPLKTGDGLPAVPLLIGNYVHVRIRGRLLKQVYTLPRRALRDHDTVYVVTGQDTLSIRHIRVLRREGPNALVKGELHPGDRVVTSRLDTAVQGMALRVFERGSKGEKRNQKGHKGTQP